MCEFPDDVAIGSTAVRALGRDLGLPADSVNCHPFLGRVANRVINDVRGVNRVTYDITSNPPGTIERERERRQ